MMNNQALVQSLENIKECISGNGEAGIYESICDIVLDRIKQNLMRYIPNCDMMTVREIEIGKRDGKISCVRALMKRTGNSVANCKQTAENYFEKNNLKFGPTN